MSSRRASLYSYTTTLLLRNCEASSNPRFKRLGLNYTYSSTLLLHSLLCFPNWKHFCAEETNSVFLFGKNIFLPSFFPEASELVNAAGNSGSLFLFSKSLSLSSAGRRWAGFNAFAAERKEDLGAKNGQAKKSFDRPQSILPPSFESTGEKGPKEMWEAS